MEMANVPVKQKLVRLKKGSKHSVVIAIFIIIVNYSVLFSQIPRTKV